MKNSLRLSFVLSLGTLLLLTACSTPNGGSLPHAFTGEPVRIPVEVANHLYYGRVTAALGEGGPLVLTLDAEADEGEWETGVFWRVPEPMAAGEPFLVRIRGVWAGPGESVEMPVMLEQEAEPWTKVLHEVARFGGREQEQEFRAVMTPDVAGQDAQITLHLGGLTGVLQITHLELLRYPQ